MRALESFPEVPVTNHVVTACQSFNFQLGMGSLYFAHTWGFVLMNGMTFPVIMLFFGLPLRLYDVCQFCGKGMESGVGVRVGC